MTDNAASAAFERGCAFVEANARPLDIARLRFRRAEAPASAVLDALAPYQNEDGGFGHGLEPDLSTPASSAIATSVGFQALREIGAGADEPMVRRGLGWLAANFDAERGVWPIIGPDVDLALHAFWWAWDADLANRWNGFRFNPSIELFGVLCAYRDAVPTDLFDRAEAALIDALAAGQTPQGAYDIKCALRLLATPQTPVRVRAALEAPVRAAIAALATDDAHAPVLDLAPTPTSPLAELVADRIDAAFDHLLAEQQPDGGWSPFWDWSAVDADAWRKAEQDWRGILTRQALEVLLAYGRA